MLYRETFVAGVQKSFNVPGNYFRVKRVNGATLESLTCDLFRDGAKLPESLPFADAGDFAYVAGGFDRVEVTSTVAQEVTVQIARGRVGSDRVLGEVSVIDGGKFTTLSGQGFMGRIVLPAGGAGVNAHAQLWLATAGIRAIIEGFSCSVPALSGFTLGFYNAMLTTNIGACQSKNDAGAGSNAFRKSQQVALLALIEMTSLDLLAATPYTWKFTRPLVIHNNQGLCIQNVTANQGISVNFDFYEEADT